MNKEFPKSVEISNKPSQKYINSQIFEVLKDHRHYIPMGVTLEEFTEEIKKELRLKNRIFIQEIINSQEACDLDYSKLLKFIIDFIRERNLIIKNGGKQLNLDLHSNSTRSPTNFGEIDVEAGDLWK